MNVALTGACSTLARSVLGLLDQDDRVESILALDIRPYQGVPSAKIQFQRTDIRSLSALRTAFARREAVIHLAFVVVSDVPDFPTIQAVSIEGSKNVMQAAADCGVRKLIYTSSVAAYGAVPGNPALVNEETPIRGEENRNNFYYSYTKAAVEKAMDDFVQAHPQLVLTRFRPHLVAGPNFLEHTGNLASLSRIAGPSRSYWAFRAEGPNGSLLQYTHEEDLAKAVQYALHHDMPGAYNIAGEPLDFVRYLKDRGKTFRRIPWAGAYALASLLSPFSARSRLGRSWLVSARYRNILDCSKLKRAGFDRPLRTTLQCVQEAVAYYEQRGAGRAKRARAQGNGQG
jgi:UDP-glucose 4-epimerase